MSYAINYSILDKNKKIVKEFKNVACFSRITEVPFTNVSQYLEYYFDDHYFDLTIDHLYKFFLFVKNIPEFSDLMPYDPLKLAQEKKITIDLDKMNGVKLFSLLTVVRAVKESPNIIKKVLEFDPEKEYSLTKLGILKACGTRYNTNIGHWLTKDLSINGLNDSPNKDNWSDLETAKQTGLKRLVHITWENGQGGYGVKDPVTEEYIETVLKEGKPEIKKRTPRKKKDVLNPELRLF